ncbi:TRY3, partial [Symbiodinium pilosum]
MIVYTLLGIKDVVACLQTSELAEALTANTAFEEELAAEIGLVNQCFSRNQHDLLNRTAQLSEELHTQQGPGSDDGGSIASKRSDALRHLVDILQEVDQLRKYAVWNAVAVVKILKKRRKQTSFGIEDTAAERAGWLSRQTFFSGSDFAELHASIESLGHMLVLSELVPEGAEHAGAFRSQSNQEPQQCPICLDTITDMVELSCKHRFCWKCFVLGPIAFQPGEYRITQCPICRRETCQTGEADGAGESMACRQIPNVVRGHPRKVGAEPLMSGPPQPTQEGFLTRFLHTYFPGEVPHGRHTDQK